MLKVAVLGSGNGGLAAAADFALQGHDVFLYDFKKFPINIQAVSKNGGIFCEGDIQGFAKISYAGHDIKKVVDHAELLFIVGPAYSTQLFGEAYKPYLKRGQAVIICPSSCLGSLVFKKAVGLDLESDDILVAETSTLPYACRTTKPGEVKVFLKLKGGVFIAALPSKHNKSIFELVKEIYPCFSIAKNILETTLQNSNPVLHPAITLLNVGLLERTKGDFNFYEEGVTAGVGKLIEAIDQERVAIGKKLGLEIIPDPIIGVQQGYMQEATYVKGYNTAKGFEGIKAQGQLDHRYFHEDVGYGLVFLSDLASQIGVSTPIIDSIINIVSVLMDRDYKKEKVRTVNNLGLVNINANPF